MANLRNSLAKILKLAIAAVLLITVVVIVANFISYSKKRPEVLEVDTDSPPEISEKMERGQFQEIKGKEETLKATFDEQYVDDEGLLHAVGNVYLLYRKKYELQANEIIYDKEWTHFVLEGKAKVQYEDTTLEGSFLEYDKQVGLIRTDRSATFSSERINGFAQDLLYDINRERLELNDQVYLQINTRLNPALPIIVEGDRFEYRRKERKGFMEGNVRFSQGDSHGEADSVEFELFVDEENVRFVWLRGNVRGTLVEESENGKIQRTVQAEEMLLRAFLNDPKIHAIEAEGACRFEFFLPSGNFQQGESEILEFVLSRQGRLREFHAEGQARLVDTDVQTGEKRIIEGESLDIVEAQEGLQIKGSETFLASISSEDFELSAEEILLDTEKNNCEASGQVKVILTAAQGDKAMGFFSQEKAIFISAEEMRYSDEHKRFMFSGGVKSWQENEIVITDMLSIDQLTGEIQCEGKVKSVFTYTSQNTQEQVRVEISAKKMGYDPETKMITFQDETSLKSRDVDMTCQSIQIVLAQEESTMQNITALGSVIIKQQQVEGRGKEARFDVEKETIVLLGNPVLIDKNRGKVEGDKLTFYIADDRIVVENQGQERSLTVIKS